jgi:hypothetical protein
VACSDCVVGCCCCPPILYYVYLYYVYNRRRPFAACDPYAQSSPSKPPQPANAHANRPQPQPVTDYDDFMDAHGSAGGWADVDHARWRRCLSRANSNYGAAVLLAAEELAAFGIERQEVIRHARWDAEREDLLLKKKAAVQRWRSGQQEAAAAHREALASEIQRAEEATRARQAAEAAAARSKEKEALKEWKARKKLAEEGAQMAKAAVAETASEERAERARIMKRERAEREVGAVQVEVSYTHSLKAPVDPTLEPIKRKTTGSKPLLSQIQLVPLRPGAQRAARASARGGGGVRARRRGGRRRRADSLRAADVHCGEESRARPARKRRAHRRQGPVVRSVGQGPGARRAQSAAGGGGGESLGEAAGRAGQTRGGCVGSGAPHARYQGGGLYTFK